MLESDSTVRKHLCASKRSVKENGRGRTAARGSLKLMIAHTCLLGCGYLIVVTLARGLGPKEYGIYGIIISFLVGIELIGRLGIPQAISKLSAENQAASSHLEGTGLVLSLMIYLVIFVLFWLSAPALAHVFRVANGTALFRLAAIDIPFYGMYFMCLHILNGQRQFGMESLGISIYGFAKAAGILALLLCGLSTSGALMINAFASVVALVFVASRIALTTLVPAWKYMVLIMRLAFPLALFFLGSEILFHLDLWCLKVFGRGVSEETIGMYVAALNVAKLPNIAYFVMMAVLIPSISRALSLNDMALAQRYVHGAVRFLSIVLLPVCVLLALKAESVMVLLYSNHYADGAAFLRILVFRFGLFFTFLMTFCAMFIARGLPLWSAGITLALVLIAGIFHLLFILGYGAQGAAISATLVTALGAIIAGLLMHQWMGRFMLPSVLSKVVLATAGMTIVGAQCALTGPLLIVECVALLGFYALLLGCLGELKRADLQPLAFWR